MEPNTARIEALIRELLVEIGEDPDREGLLRTPQRVAAGLRLPHLRQPDRTSTS